jgi:hypothetical protein
MEYTWKTVPARIVEGHRVASGLNGNPHFPGGTLRMQLPVFKELGLDLSQYYPGTLNVSVAPLQYRVVQPKMTFRKIKWHPIDPPEDFSFFDARITKEGETAVEGFVYHPHPETKPKHFQAPDVLELLFPYVKDLDYGMLISLGIPSEQMVLK